MGMIFKDRCEKCKKLKEPIVKLRAVIYDMGFIDSRTIRICTDCLVKIKTGKSNVKLVER